MGPVLGSFNHSLQECDEQPGLEWTSPTPGHCIGVLAKEPASGCMASSGRRLRMRPWPRGREKRMQSSEGQKGNPGATWPGAATLLWATCTLQCLLFCPQAPLASIAPPSSDPGRTLSSTLRGWGDVKWLAGPQPALWEPTVEPLPAAPRPFCAVFLGLYLLVN